MKTKIFGVTLLALFIAVSVVSAYPIRTWNMHLNPAQVGIYNIGDGKTWNNLSILGINLSGAYRMTWPVGNTSAEIWGVCDNGTFLTSSYNETYSATTADVDANKTSWAMDIVGANVTTTTCSIGSYVSQINNDTGVVTCTTNTYANRTTTTISTTSTGITNVLSLPLTAGKTVRIKCELGVWSINTTNTIQVNVTWSGTAEQHILAEYYTSATAQALQNSSATSKLVNPTSGAGLVTVPFVIDGDAIVNGGGGTFSVGIRAEIAGSLAAVNPRSSCKSEEW